MDFETLKQIVELDDRAAAIRSALLQMGELVMAYTRRADTLLEARDHEGMARLRTEIEELEDVVDALRSRFFANRERRWSLIAAAGEAKPLVH